MLDATPGDVRAGGGIRQDHPADLISALLGVALPLPSRSTLQALLGQQGFSPPIAKWASTNLRAIDGDHRCPCSCEKPWVATRSHKQDGASGGHKCPRRPQQGCQAGRDRSSRWHVPAGTCACWHLADGACGVAWVGALGMWLCAAYEGLGGCNSA